MRVIKINRHRISKKVLDEVAAALRAGQVVAYPTETAYGLAADPDNADAVAQVYRIKGRPDYKPLPLIASDIQMVRKYAKLSGKLAQLAEKHWPGPLTLILSLRGAAVLRPRGNPVSQRTVAIRVPASVIARKIATALGHPITSTSANLSGRPTIYSGSGVITTFANRKFQPDIILDAGALPMHLPSTIIALEHGKVKVLRQGEIKIA